MSNDLLPVKRGQEPDLFEMLLIGFMRTCVWSFRNPGKAMLIIVGIAVVLLIL